MRWLTGLVVISVLAAAALNVVRLVFGVDFTDEALYVALPWRFVRGDRPLIDEYNMAQLAALLCVPVLKVWSTFAGSEAIVLVMRVLHLVLRAGAAAIVAWSLAPMLGRRLAVVASLFTFAMVPIGLPSVSYNTVSALAFTAGCFAGLARDRGWRGAALAGALHAIAVIAYPPFALAVALFIIARPFAVGSAYALAYVVAAAVACLPYAIVFARAGLHAVQRMVAFASSATKPEPLLQRLADVGYLFAAAPRWPVLLAALAILGFVVMRRSPALAWLLVLVPLVAFINRLPLLYSSMGFTAWLAMLGGVLTLVLWREDADARRLLACAWLPGIAAGFITAVFSSNRAVNFGIGALVGAQAAVALLALLATRRLGAKPLAAFATMTLCWMIPTAQQFFPSTIYRDDDVQRLTARVRRGAYAGLYTTPQKRAWLERLEDDLARTQRHDERIFFYYDFPAGYLLTPMRPAAPSVWTLSGAEARVADRLPATMRAPSVAVRMVHVPYFREIRDHNEFPPDDALDSAFRGYRTAVAREDYQILVRTRSLPLHFGR